MENSTPPVQKKGLSPLAWIGIGCGGIIVLAIIAFAVFGLFFGGKIKKFAEEAQANPTRATASMMVSVGGAEMVQEDDENKRYTVKDTKSGQLTTFYWDPKTQQPAQVSGDFSAIPAPSDLDAETLPEPEPVPELEPAPAAQ